MEELVKPRAGQYLTFQLQTEQYGITIETVREINQYVEITPVPRTPEYLKGVMNLRGKIIPVIDLRLKLGMTFNDRTRDTCIIIVDTKMGQLGMVVDTVKEVVHLEDINIELAPKFGSGDATSFVRGMGKVDNKVVILIDIEATFTIDQFNQLGGIETSKPVETAA